MRKRSQNRTGTNDRNRSISAFALAITVAVGRSAMATSDNWTQTSGGSWETPGNWNLNTMPSLTNGYDAVFNTGAGIAYTVTLPDTESAQNLFVQNDKVTFDTTGNLLESLEVGTTFNVLAGMGQTTSLTLLGTSGGYGVETDNGTFNVGGAGTAYFNDTNVQLTDDGGSFNFGAGSIVTITNATLRGGHAGDGLIERGTATLVASLEGDVVVGAPGSAGAVLNGSVSTSAGNLNIGSGGTGTFNGVASNFTTINIGADSAGTWNASSTVSGETINVGTAGVSGVLNGSSGATIDAMLQLNIGANGIVRLNGATLNYPYLSVSPSAQIEMTSGTLHGLIPGSTLALPATAALQGTGSVTANFNNSGTVSVGDQAGNGILAIGGSFNESAGSFLDVSLGGISVGNDASLDGYSQLDVSGAAVFGGTLDVTLANGFTPLAGESFNILDFGSASGSFSTVDLPPLASGLSWNTQSLYSSGTISVVPEPATVGMLGVIGLGMLRRLRRQGRARNCGTH
jgi:hypothetical protein